MVLTDVTALMAFHATKVEALGKIFSKSATKKNTTTGVTFVGAAHRAARTA